MVYGAVINIFAESKILIIMVDKTFQYVNDNQYKMTKNLNKICKWHFQLVSLKHMLHYCIKFCSRRQINDAEIHIHTT